MRETHMSAESEVMESGRDKETGLNPHKQLSANISAFTGSLQTGHETDILMTTLDKTEHTLLSKPLYYVDIL